MSSNLILLYFTVGFGGNSLLGGGLGGLGGFGGLGGGLGGIFCQFYKDAYVRMSHIKLNNFNRPYFV